ncbi:hypothetical protein C5167_018536 [Papaver somniferum]|uniref:Uncharacterized protein n=2 Tax=Papaver somniferum TaxID=3469 RepID=A0A4Y7IRJ8_PAPSO|nr:hypothetical protein C5167_018536 [Papaver somniferum]
MQSFRDPISTITGPYSPSGSTENNSIRWAAMDNDDIFDSRTSSFQDVIDASTSSSSLDLEEEEEEEDGSLNTSSSSSSSSSINGPLFELSDLMEHLPIKRGLSKHFDGKSQSFTSLSNVNCLEDLAKGGIHFRKKKSSSRSNSYGDGLDVQNKRISKKSSLTRGCFVSSLVDRQGISFNLRTHANSFKR